MMPAFKKKQTFEALQKIQHQVHRVALFCAGLLGLGAGVVAQEEKRHTERLDVLGLCASRITAQKKKTNKKRDVDAFSQSARSSPQTPFKLETQVVTTHQ